MDADANLREQCELAERILDGHGTPEDGERLAELGCALDAWIESGGFPPQRWLNGTR